MKTKMLVLLILLMFVLVGVLSPQPVLASPCLHLPPIWGSALTNTYINVSWECRPTITDGIRPYGWVTLQVPNESAPGYHYEQVYMEEHSGIEDPPTAIFWNIPPYPYPGYWHPVAQGLYWIVGFYAYVNGVRYDMSQQGMYGPVCLPNPNGC